MMMTILKRTVLPGIFILSLLLSWTAVAENANVPTQKNGKIEYVDIKTGEIVVNDSILPLASDYVVKNRAGKVVSAFNLKKGQLIQINYDSNNVVKEIIIK
jgi:hypothetical protein